MLVELFALPGAGKTTVANAVAKQTNVTTRKILSLAWAGSSGPKRISHIAQSLGSPSHLAAAMRFAVGTRLTTGESLFRLTRLLAKRDWLKSRRDVILLDQGFVQDLWSVLISAKAERPDPKLLSHLIRALYKDIDATIVVIEIEPQLAAERISGRSKGHSRFDDRPQSEIGQSLGSLGELHHRIVEAVKLAGLPVHMIDGSRPLDSQADELRSLLPVPRPQEIAQGIPAPPRRISIIGSTGSGKTRLAKLLAKRLELPAVELDQLRGSSSDRFEDAVAAATSEKAWIIDGHYRSVRHLIWSRADLVVWLNYPLRVVAAQLISRFARKRVRAARTPEALGGNDVGETKTTSHQQPASWSRRFSRLYRTMLERREYGRLLKSPEYRALRVVELKSRRMTQLWLESL